MVSKNKKEPKSKKNVKKVKTMKMKNNKKKVRFNFKVEKDADKRQNDSSKHESAIDDEKFDTEVEQNIDKHVDHKKESKSKKANNKSLITQNKDFKSDTELYDAADEDDNEMDDNEVSRLNLIEKLSKLGEKKNNRAATRTEFASDISENTLIPTSEQLRLKDLVESMNMNKTNGIKDVEKVDKKRLLDVPINKVVTERLIRENVFRNVKKETSKWQPIINANRDADQLDFTKSQGSLEIFKSETVKQFVERFEPETELEKQVYSYLKKSKANLTSDAVMSNAEVEYLKSISLEEANEKLKEIRKMRALMSYQEKKFRQQKKIKSKNYHRLLKKERLKQCLKDFEMLKKVDPQQALEKLERIDKLRALERASLKHRNTGKWAKHNLLRSKNDKTVREALAEQVHLNKQLTVKRVDNKQLKEDLDEDMEWGDKNQLINDNKNNDNNHLNDNSINDLDELPEVNLSYNPWLKSNNELIDLKKLIKENEIKKNNKTSNEISNDDKNEIQLNPNKFITKMESKVKSILPKFSENIKTNDNENGDDVDENDDYDDDTNVDDEYRINAMQTELIAEAFADDDVINNFIEEKEETVDKQTPKDINLYLPGWGSWGGCGIQDDEEKKSKFTIKAKKQKRRDESLPNVIISEKRDSVISKYMVKQLPHPFKNVVQYENSIRLPIGNTWNPETVVKDLTKPSVVTARGKIIKPMNEEALVDIKIKRILSKNKATLEDFLSID